MSDILRPMGKSKTLINLLYVLIGVFILLVLSILAPDTFSELRGNMFAFALFGLGGTFMVLGFVIGILAKRQIKDPKLKKFLMLAGFSAGSFLILTVLHNMFYAVAETFQHIAIVKYVATALDVISFLVSIFVVPVTFLVGVIGSIVVYNQGKKGK